MNAKFINRGKQLKFVRGYRGYSQTELCKQIKGLSQSNLSKFEKGFNTIKEDKLRIVMEFLNWPFEFLDKVINIKLEI